jgi:nucleoside-diphosphate-sugar epimerase
MPNTKLIIGCGYLGRRVAELWRSQGDEVWATTRSRERFAELETLGVKPVLFDVASAATQSALPEARTVLYAVGFDRSAGVTMRTVYVEGLRRTLDALPNTVERILYISSTGVYGQSDGSVVDEESPTEPTRDGGQVVLEAERVLQSHPMGDRAVILRLAGIYGPGRLPRLEAIRSGEPIVLPEEGYLNLIHVKDAARIALLAEQHASLPRTYLVSDGHPIKRRTFYEEIARRLGLPRVTFIEPSADAPAAPRSESNKRLDLRRLLTELPVTLKYPNYRHGLKAILGD